MSNLSFTASEQEIPIGRIKKNQMLALANQDRVGNMLILGALGQGKSVFATNLIVADLLAGRGGLLIDPYGDLINDILSYIPDERKADIAIYEVNPEGLEASLAEFENEFALDIMAEDKAKCIMCKLSFAQVGAQVAREVGLRILQLFYQTFGTSTDLEQRFLFVDEAAVFLDGQILQQLTLSRDQKLNCILADETLRYMSEQMTRDLMYCTDHLICFKVDRITTSLVSAFGGLEKTADEIRDLKRFEFWAGLLAGGVSQPAVRAGTIWPLPFEQVG